MISKKMKLPTASGWGIKNIIKNKGIGGKKWL